MIDDVKTLMFAFCALLAWTAVGYKATALRKDPRNLRLWAVLATIALPSAGLTVAIGPVYNAVGRLTGFVHLPTLLMYLAVVGYAISVLVMSLLIDMPTPQARRLIKRYLVLYAAAVLAMVVLFFRIEADPADPLALEKAYTSTLTGGMFLLVFVAAFGIGLAAEARQGWRLSRRVAREGGRPWLSRGQRWTAIGSSVAFGYCAAKAAFVTEALLTDTHSYVLSDLGTICACIGAIVITIGLTMPGWGPRCTALAQRIRRASAYVRLYDLWAELHRLHPGIALDPPASRLADLARLHDLDFALGRRVVEIHDGLRVLGAEAEEPDPAAEQLALKVGLPLAAVREASRIRDAISGRFGTPTASAAGTARAADGAHEDPVVWLVQVATALRKLPSVRQPLNDRQPTPTPERQ